MEETYTIKTLQELDKLSQNILSKVGDVKKIIFKGDLGSGKTSLIKFLLKNLGSMDQVSSPSFSIINHYKAEEKNIYHFDLYRLESIEEFEELGIFEYLDSDEYCFIEWPELLEPYLDMPYFEIKMTILENNDRNVLILKS